ncbi:MAG: putative GNAT family N-acyltransferase [Myxococcota bacterium]
MIRVQWITQADPAYAGERDLRYRLLRAPIGMPRGSEENRDEAACRHVVALDGADQVVGCLIFRRDDATRGQLMQMAVDPSVHGSGVGRAVVESLEATMAAEGLKTIYLHARETAVGFYEKLGYTVYGEPYDEVGIPHRDMHRQI